MRTAVAIATALSLALAPVAPALGQGAPAPKPTPAPAKPAPQPSVPGKAAAGPASTAAPTPAPPDGGWPRGYTTPSGGKIIVYQPQMASWTDQKHMVAYSAVSYEVKGATKPALGSIKLEADTKVSVSERLVSFHGLKITESSFGTLPKEQMREVVDEIEKAIPDEDRVIGLDRVLASVDRSQIMPKNIEGVKADPPTIFFSKKAAVLVNIDGDPIWSPIKDNDLKFAVNTNWDLFSHEPSKVYYLRNEQVWLKASDFKGPWTAAGKLPDSFKKLPPDANWTDVKAALPGKSVSADKLPQVFVSTTPAEMILLAGEPKYEPVAGTSLLWVGNTESDVFRMGAKGNVYYLVAGRWFSAPDFTGPWTFSTPNLPAEFQKISLEHPRSRVLASVPGTQQAAEGVLLAQVPQTARVNKKQIQAPEVKYQGEPKFQPVEKTKVERAVNTDKSIIKVGDMYYMCHEGVWFMGSSPNGPWSVCTKVPGEIYEIPISSPAHNVTYVTVEDDDDDEWATFATAAMYTGVMVAWGCAVWGSGWYYPPYYGGFYGGYPMYYGHYPTYGYRASYNPWTGAYSRGAVAYGPYGGAGVGARYNPRTGNYSRGAAAYGPYGGAAAGRSYNPRTGTYGQTRQASNVYGSWGSTQVQRGDQWASTNRVTNRATGTTTRTTRTSGGGEAVTRRGPGGTSGVARTGSGDVYAGRDGNVYRNQGGSWQKYENGSWGNVNRPTPQSGSRTGGTYTGSGTVDQLNRDRGARSEGTQRTRDYGSYSSGRSSGSSYRSSGYSRSGGGYRGGGGRGGGRRR
jgi:hypothetical protein